MGYRKKKTRQEWKITGRWPNIKMTQLYDIKKGVALNARFLDAELYNHSIKYKITSVEGYVVGCINYLVILSTFNTIQPSNPIMSVSKVYHQNLI